MFLYKDNNKENIFGSSSLCFYVKPTQNINNRKVKGLLMERAHSAGLILRNEYFFVLLKSQKLLVGAFMC